MLFWKTEMRAKIHRGMPAADESNGAPGGGGPAGKKSWCTNVLKKMYYCMPMFSKKYLRRALIFLLAKQSPMFFF